VHQYFPDVDQDPIVIQNLNGLNTDGLMTIMTPNMQDQVNLKSPVSAIQQVSGMIRKNADIINDLFHSDLLAAAKISNLGALMKTYVNARVKGFQGDFPTWLKSNVTANKLENLIGPGGAITVQGPAVAAVFDIFKGIVMIKANLIQQLDAQQHTIQSSINGNPGGEGYVFATSEGLIKLVDRASFSAANFAKND
jgi:hypothetical protein